MSGRSFFKGLYPDHNDTAPINIALSDNPFNFLDYKYSKFLPIYNKNNENNLNKLNEFVSNFSLDFSHLRENKNVPSKIFTDWTFLNTFLDTVLCDVFDNRNLSALNVDSAELKKRAIDGNALLFKVLDHSHEIASIGIPPIIEEINKFYTKQINREKGPKVFIYFAHDSTVSIFLNYLIKAGLTIESFSYSNIEFASNIIIEFSLENDCYYTSIYYNKKLIFKNKTSTPNPLNSSFLETTTTDTSTFLNTDAADCDVKIS